MASQAHRWQKGRGLHFADYLPFIVILALTVLSALAIQSSLHRWNWMAWMNDFMGFFLVVFSMFKFFDMEGFADGFHMYDLLAIRFRAYAFVYPFIELALGLAYLARWKPRVVYAVTIVVMLLGTAGVLRALIKGLDVNCACMGTVLKVPLSTVALVEDAGMAVMAAIMLVMMRGA
jgi:hypothetical protein